MKDINQLEIVKYNNQIVLLTSKLAESYGTSNKIISYNFNNNKDRYIEGKHYFKLEGKEKKDFINHLEIQDGLKNAKTVYLWTERGAFLHAKSLNTDKAWEMYDSLVEYYFNSVEAKPKALPMTYKEALIQLVEQVEENERLELEIEEQKPLVEFANHVSNTSDLIDIGRFSKLLKDEHIEIGRNRLFEWLRNHNILMLNNTPYQRYIDSGYFKVKESVRNTPYGQKIYTTTYVTGKGQIYLTEKLRKSYSVK